MYWFDVFFKGDLLTRMPLRVVYQRLEVGQSGGTPFSSDAQIRIQFTQDHSLSPRKQVRYCVYFG